MEELQFTEFTGADAATAKAFLAASGGSVEAAVGAFFQTGGILPATTAAAGDAPQPPPRPTSVTMASTSQFTHGIQGKSACTTMAICACARLIDRAAAAALTAADVDAIVADGVVSYIANPLSAAGTAPHMSFGEAFAGGSAPGVGAAAPARPFSEALRMAKQCGQRTCACALGGASRAADHTPRSRASRRPLHHRVGRERTMRLRGRTLHRGRCRA